LILIGYEISDVNSDDDDIQDSHEQPTPQIFLKAIPEIGKVGMAFGMSDVAHFDESSPSGGSGNNRQGQ
jgi:hypothetical protein